MIDGLVAYIRSWFPPTDTSRKRRASNDLGPFGSPKYRKVLSPVNPIDDFLNSRLTSKRSPLAIRPTTAGFNFDQPFSFLDHDENPPSKVRNIGIKMTGKKHTPDNLRGKMSNGGADDISIIKAIKSTAEKRAEANSKGFSFISSRLSVDKGAKPKLSPATPINKAKHRLHSPLDYSGPRYNSSALERSIRLDEHQKYKELLEKYTHNNSSSIYHTPVGRLSDYDISNSRGRKLVNSATKTRSPIDLTRESTSSSSSKPKPYLSVRDTVAKVLDDYGGKRDDGPIEVQDSSDSDVEYLCTIPSPKPDIMVEPVNSLRTVIDTNETSKPTWLEKVDASHKRFVEDKQNHIKILNENSTALNDINRELLIKGLELKIRDSLQIKDQILPEVEAEEDTILEPLSDEQLRMLRRGFQGNSEEILTKKFNLNVSRRDLQTLAGLNWLNDNVINFYMNLIIERSEQGNRPRAYCMNTFFYQRLQSSGPESLRRWTRKVDLFAMEYICVPIHLGMHWCMAIINIQQKYIKYFDSMGHSNDKCLRLLKHYIEFEHMDKKQTPFSADDFQLENVQNIPQQLNGSDCGVFSCTFAEFATRKARFSFSQADMPYLRKKMAIEILTGDLLIK